MKRVINNNETYEPEMVSRVCVYCRYNCRGNGANLSFEAQEEYYKTMISKNPRWSLKRIFADEGIGAEYMDNHPAFDEMIELCKKGEYDLIISKSFPRFCKHYTDAISIINMLKSLPQPVGVYLEFDNYFSLDVEADNYLKL